MLLFAIHASFKSFERKVEFTFKPWEKRQRDGVIGVEHIRVSRTEQIVDSRCQLVRNFGPHGATHEIVATHQTLVTFQK